MAKKVLTIIFDHEDAFQDLYNQIKSSSEESKYVKITKENSDGIVVNITGNLDELTHE